MKKRADLQLVKEHSQQQARTGEGWLRQADAWRERHARAMMCVRWENKVKFLTAEALRGVNSTIFDAQGSRIDNELGKWGHVTGTALEQGCGLTRRLEGAESKRKHRAPQGSRGATTGAARHRRCSGFRGSAIAVHRRDHRHQCLGADAETK